MISPIIFDSVNVAKCLWSLSLYCSCIWYEIKISSRFYVCDGGGGGGVCVYVPGVGGFIAIAWDENNILVAVHFSMKNIYQLCDRGPSRDVEQRQRQPITFFVYWRLRDVGRVSPWR